MEEADQGIRIVLRTWHDMTAQIKNATKLNFQKLASLFVSTASSWKKNSGCLISLILMTIGNVTVSRDRHVQGFYLG